MQLTGLALCVMNGPVTDAGRLVFNTCGCTIRSASRHKLEASAFFLFQFIPDNPAPSLVDVVTESTAAGVGWGWRGGSSREVVEDDLLLQATLTSPLLPQLLFTLSKDPCPQTTRPRLL